MPSVVRPGSGGRARAGGQEAFLLEDIRRALVTGEQVGAIFGGDKGLQGMNAGEQADEIVLF